MRSTASPRCLLRSALLSCVAVLGYVPAQAQETQQTAQVQQTPAASAAAISLETIDVNPTSSRLGTSVPSRPAREREPEARVEVSGRDDVAVELNDARGVGEGTEEVRDRAARNSGARDRTGKTVGKIFRLEPYVLQCHVAGLLNLKRESGEIDVSGVVAPPALEDKRR